MRLESPCRLDPVRVAIARAQRNGEAAGALADARWGRASRPAAYLKGAVSAITAGDAVGGSIQLPVEFFDGALERSAVGRMVGLRRVPFRHRCVAIGDGTRAYWPGEGNPAPMSRLDLDFGALDPLPVRTMTVVTSAMVEAAAEEIEQGIHGDMESATSRAINEAMFDPDNAGSPGAKPASLTHGVPGEIVGDYETARSYLLDAFTGDLEAAYLAMSPATAARMNGFEHPNVGARGGDAFGIPVAPGTGIPDGVIALVDPTLIAFGSEGGEITGSREGAVQMTDDPETGATALVSLFQANAVALGITAWVNWKVMRDGAVAWVKHEAAS